MGEATPSAERDRALRLGVQRLRAIGRRKPDKQVSPVKISFPAPPAPAPLNILKFNVKKDSLNVGDKAVFTRRREGVRVMALYDLDDELAALTTSFKSVGGGASGRSRRHGQSRGLLVLPVASDIVSKALPSRTATNRSWSRSAWGRRAGGQGIYAQQVLAQRRRESQIHVTPESWRTR